jgi:hypothetical protein
MGNSLVIFAAAWLTRLAAFAARNDAAHIEALAHWSSSPRRRSLPAGRRTAIIAGCLAANLCPGTR